jgi:hypothetical protein
MKYRNMWTKSKKSAANGQCVEIMQVNPSVGGCSVLVRHSLNPHGTILAYTREEWEAFLEGVKAGEFELLPEK